MELSHHLIVVALVESPPQRSMVMLLLRRCGISRSGIEKIRVHAVDFGLMGLPGLATFTVSAGPVAVRGIESYVVLPLMFVNPVSVLVALTVTVAGAG